MQVFRDSKAMQDWALATRRTGARLALVPTMGFLHDGHLNLVARARQLASKVAVTIFVNPTQFGQALDLESYPRDEARDLDLLRAAGVDAVLIPEVADIYPEGDETIVETVNLSNVLHGSVRPGHFRGVTTVVARLFNICQPDLACFGEKDYQQLQIIRRMARDLHFPIEIIGVETVREADGLAMSSRNVRLSPADRQAALVLSRSLQAAQTATQATTAEALRSLIEGLITAEPRATLKGLDITHPETLEPLSGPLKGPAAIMLSAEFGEILLLDQKVVTP
jgi:pantoate--beta-alanine ligase